MKGFKKWSSVCLPVALIAGLVAGWMVVQQVGVTPSEAQGITEYGAILAAKLPPKLKASPTPPPEEDMGPPPDQTPRQRPTKESLLEKIRQMPGGKEMLEEARKRGARIGMGPVESETSLSWLNPLRVKVAEAQSSFSLTLDPSNNWYSSSPKAYARLYGALVGYGYPTTSGIYLTRQDRSSTTGNQIIYPCVYFYIEIPSDGWYILNLEGQTTMQSLIHYEAGAYTTVQTWSYTTSYMSGSTSVSSPAILELSAGRHYFYWVRDYSVGWVYEVDAYTL